MPGKTTKGASQASSGDRNALAVELAAVRASGERGNKKENRMEELEKSEQTD